MCIYFRQAIKDGSGVIEFKEFYKHFDALIRKKDSTWTAEKLLALYKKYEGKKKGINYGEYCLFLHDILGSK